MMNKGVSYKMAIVGLILFDLNTMKDGKFLKGVHGLSHLIGQ